MKADKGPYGPVIEELDKLVPEFPSSGSAKNEAIYFAYQQARISYYMLCNLLQGGNPVIGIYIYAWSIIDNASRYDNLMGRHHKQPLKSIRNSFQHVDEKIDLYDKGAIPVFGSLNWWHKPIDGTPKFGVFPEHIGRTFVSAVCNNSDPYHDGISHLTLSALSTSGKTDKEHKQHTVRLDSLVLEMGKEVCSMFGFAEKAQSESVLKQ